MKLAFLYLLLAIFFGFISFAGVPKYGCFIGDCAKIYSVTFDSISFVLFAFLFSFLGLKRLLKNSEFKNLNKYGSNDLSNFDG